MKGKKTIDQRLRELDELRAELLERREVMTEKEKRQALEDAQPKIERGTPAMEALLASGYGGMTVEDAQRIIKERDENPHTWPLEEYKKAQAYLAAYSTDPIPISPRRAWDSSGA